MDNERITHVIDRGIGVRAAKDLVETAGPYISVVKLGWGTGWIARGLKEKHLVYQRFHIPLCFGGTLFEWAVIHDKLDAVTQLASYRDMTIFEVSDGALGITEEEKCRHIKRLAKNFTVFSEVGKKQDSTWFSYDLDWWIECIQAELEAGATKVILEGRESGTVGIYDDEGQIDAVLIKGITKVVSHEDLIFEAPQTQQQVWFIEHFGPEVNLGNIATDDVIPLETLRQGLRADMFRSMSRSK